MAEIDEGRTIITDVAGAITEKHEEVKAAIGKHVGHKAKEAIDAMVQKDSATERKARGKELRKTIPRASLATFAPAEGRPDPVDIVKAQDEKRTPSLVPLRHERMSASAFTFYRGAAAIMATDLSAQPTTGITVQDCGDAHISNFGFFTSTEGRTTFDLNDFDETLPGPWEWDIKRLVTSIEICGRDRGFKKKVRTRLSTACARTYREAMLNFAKQGNMEVWNAHIDVQELIGKVEASMSKKDRKTAEESLRKVQSKNSTRAVAKLTEMTDEGPRFISQPPVVMPLRDFVDEKNLLETVGALGQILKNYVKSLAPDRRNLIKQYHPVDIAHKVVGVGSVGTQAWVVLLVGELPDDFLVLQIKEAQASVLEQFCGKSGFATHGERVVAGQRAIQSTADVLLGWTKASIPGLGERDFYVRQLWNGKGSVDLETINPDMLEAVASAAAWTLARAHARTGDRFAIAGYLGKGAEFDKAMAKFAAAYAEQNEKDFARFTEARVSGELS